MLNFTGFPPNPCPPLPHPPPLAKIPLPPCPQEVPSQGLPKRFPKSDRVSRAAPGKPLPDWETLAQVGNLS